jgi:hypothetical protein
MRILALAGSIGLGLCGPALAQDCTSLIKSMCSDTTAQENTTRRVLKVEVKPPAYAMGDRFPVEERSLLMNPTSHGLPAVDGPWRYYAMDGVVYKVANDTAKVIEVIRDRRTWRLR